MHSYRIRAIFPRHATLRALAVIVLASALLAAGCRPNPDISTRPRTLYEAWDLLSSYVDEEGLVLYGYATIELDEDGRSDDYTLSAYHPDKDALYVLRTRPNRIRFYSLPHPDDRPTAPIEAIQDTPALMAAALEESGRPCTGELSMGINLPEDRADALCSRPRWAVKLSPYIE
jgi:hypothetical protein